jgi:D-alanyl-D-alanine carboxypeptidase
MSPKSPVLKSIAAMAAFATFSTVAAVSAHADDRYASFVINVDTNEVMHARNASELRHPASLTKIMTLYLLFDALERGELTLESELVASSRAAAQAPSKIGIRPGQSIRVEDAILALVTKSANDVAVVIAESLAGTEAAFAERMTTRARELGMSSTTFVNASGLPNSRQVTTARDLALLSESMFSEHQRYYHYFSTPVMSWNGGSYGNHNRLLGRIEGVDGIKTGYTRSSGFNLSTSATRDGHRIVAVVMGGDTGSERDEHMVDLVNAAFSELERRDRAATLRPGAASPFSVAYSPSNPGDLGVAGLGEVRYVGMTDPNSVRVNMDAVMPTRRAQPREEMDEDTAERDQRPTATVSQRVPPPVSTIPVS